MSLTFLYHPDTLLHDTGTGHPERRQRLESLVSHLMGRDLWAAMAHARPDEASHEQIAAAHEEGYIAWVRQRIEEGATLLDSGDTHVCSKSWRAALLAAGGAIAAVDAACGPEKRHAFSAARPPGHHAESEKAMGFCLFDNIAIGARYAQKRYGVERVAIVDWDVHHGNGTQDIFWRDPSVLFISIHQFPLWPGTGEASSAGEGEGKGFTLNCPMPPGSGEQQYEGVFRSTIVPKLREFRPDMLMISAGFDAHRADPLANIELTEGSFALLTRMVAEVCAPSTSAGIVSVLEGGYDLKALSGSVEAHLRVLAEG